MRPGMLLTLTGSWLVLSVMTQPLAGAARPVSAQTSSPNDKVAVVTVEGQWQSTVVDARLSAQAQVRDKVVEHLRGEGLVFERVPSMDELRPVLAKTWKEKLDNRNFPDNVGLMHHVTLEVPVTPELRSFVVHQNQLLRSQERMLLLGKVLFVA